MSLLRSCSLPSIHGLICLSVSSSFEMQCLHRMKVARNDVVARHSIQKAPSPGKDVLNGGRSHKSSAPGGNSAAEIHSKNFSLSNCSPRVRRGVLLSSGNYAAEIHIENVPSLIQQEILRPKSTASISLVFLTYHPPNLSSGENSAAEIYSENFCPSNCSPSLSPRGCCHHLEILRRKSTARIS